MTGELKQGDEIRRKDGRHASMRRTVQYYGSAHVIYTWEAILGNTGEESLPRRQFDATYELRPIAFEPGKLYKHRTLNSGLYRECLYADDEVAFFKVHGSSDDSLRYQNMGQSQRKFHVEHTPASP